MRGEGKNRLNETMEQKRFRSRMEKGGGVFGGRVGRGKKLKKRVTREKK